MILLFSKDQWNIGSSAELLFHCTSAFGILSAYRSLLQSTFVAVAFVGVCLVVYGNLIHDDYLVNGQLKKTVIFGIVAVLIASVFDALHLVRIQKNAGFF